MAKVTIKGLMDGFSAAGKSLRSAMDEIKRDKDGQFASSGSSSGAKKAPSKALQAAIAEKKAKEAKAAEAANKAKVARANSPEAQRLDSAMSEVKYKIENAKEDGKDTSKLEAELKDLKRRREQHG